MYDSKVDAIHTKQEKKKTGFSLGNGERERANSLRV
jgi:hypothetical protein